MPDAVNVRFRDGTAIVFDIPETVRVREGATVHYAIYNWSDLSDGLWVCLGGYRRAEEETPEEWMGLFLSIHPSAAERALTYCVADEVERARVREA